MKTLHRLAFTTVALVAAAAAACTEIKPDPDDDFADLAAGDLKSDHGSNQIQLLGSLGYGATSPAVRYESVPRFRAFQFEGRSGDAVEIWVRGSGRADAVAYLLDGQFAVLAWNDDATPRTLDAQIVHTLPTTGTHYIVFRDYHLSSGRFRVSLDGSPASGCLYDGVTYAIGDSFDATDGCNTCICTEAGYGCTKLGCDTCDPASEPYRNYVAASPETCAVIRFECPAQSWYFSNACGCGCEQDVSCPDPIDCKPPTDCSELVARCPLSTIAG